TNAKMNCYAILGLIHSLWRPVPGRFKDYIAIPKSNLYQYLHTTVVGPKGEHVEFQIRTEEMHRVAEYGISAHGNYKERGQIGDHCVGAKVNGKIVSLKHQLASGDTIEILTSSTQVPHKDWLKFVRTPRAKTKIKHWLKIEEQKRSLEIGRRLLEREFRRQG